LGSGIRFGHPVPAVFISGAPERPMARILLTRNADRAGWLLPWPTGSVSRDFADDAASSKVDVSLWQ
jgi:hypothetical protein